MSTLFADRLFNTILLVGTGTVLSILIGVGFGVIAGWFRGKKEDHAAVTFSILFYAMPSFWIGMVLIYLFAVIIPVFPSGGIIDI